MNNQPKLLAVLTSAALLAGCAGGGGGGVEVTRTPIPQPTPTAEIRCAWLLPFICGWFEPDSDEAIVAGFRFSSLASQRPARFATWSGLAPNQSAEFDAIGTELTYVQAPSGVITATSIVRPPEQQLFSDGPRYTADKELAAGTVFRLTDGIDVTVTRSGDALKTGVIANPHAQGWNYQSFGVWNSHGASTQQIAAFSFGAATPASAVPTSGNASFVGKLGGVYVSPAGEGSVASADVRVNANFNSRSLSFASSGTSLTQDLKTARTAPHLDLAGTLTYSPATNTFSGTVTNAGATMNGSSTGRFYGPAAQELGGVLTVKSPTTVETLTGAYGAKR